MNQRTFLLLVAGLFAIRLVTLPVLPLLDPSESRYAVVARDMIERGDFVTPMIWANGEYVPFWSKPPLLFWLQATAMTVLGPSEVAARLPSAAGALLILLLTWLLLRRDLASDLLRGAVLVLLSSPLFFLGAGIGLTDMLLCVSVAGALFSHWRYTRETDPARARRASLLTFALLGIGMVAKGPVALVEFGLPVVLWTAWNRRWSDVTGQAWWPGLLLFAAIAAPWYLLAERATPGFLRYFFLNENFLRFAAEEYGDRYGGGHKFPPGAAVVFFLLAALPWLVLLLWRLRDAGARREARSRLARGDLQLFAFAVVANVGFLSFSRHILGTYLLPVLPAAAVILAALLVAVGVGIRRMAGIAAALVVAYAILIVAGLPWVRTRWSSELVLERAAAFQKERGAKGRIVFVEKQPFSARFYGGPDVDHIPWDAGNEHYWWYLVPENGHLMILRTRHPRMLDPYVTDRLRLVEEDGRYSIWEPVAPPAK